MSSPHPTGSAACLCNKEQGEPSAENLPPPPLAAIPGADRPRNSTTRPAVLQELRARIRAIEEGRDPQGPNLQSPNPQGPDQKKALSVGPWQSPSWSPAENGTAARTDKSKTCWNLGVEKIDSRLPGGGLLPGGLHEIKPPANGDWACNHATAAAFMFCLLRRRMLALAAAGEMPKPILLCWPERQAGELGNIYGPGLRNIGLAPALLIIATPKTARDGLWVMEEGLKSGAVSAIAGLMDDLDLTSARRLSMAAAAHGTPCLLLTHPRGNSAGSSATRWRAGPSPPLFYDASQRARDKTHAVRHRFKVALERCRYGGRDESHNGKQNGGSGSALPEDVHYILEWSDEAHCFDLSTPLANRAAGAPFSPAVSCTPGRFPRSVLFQRDFFRPENAGSRENAGNRKRAESKRELPSSRLRTDSHNQARAGFDGG